MLFFYLGLAVTLSSLALLLSHFLLRKKRFPLFLRILLRIGEFLLSTTIAFLFVGLLTVPRFLFIIMVALYVALLMDALARIIVLIVEAIRKKKSVLLLPILTLSLSIGYTGYGMVKMEIVVPEHIEVRSSKLKRSYDFAFLADLHVGSAQPFSITEKTVREVKSTDLDFILIGGDLVDLFTTKEQMQASFALFEDAPCPVYFIDGNHEIDDLRPSCFSKEEMEQEAIARGIHILKDDFVFIGEDLLLLGREDLASSKRKGYEELVNPRPDSFLLIADHQPGDFKAASSYGVDLQISGHTHDGQVFPLGWFYALATYPYGNYYQGASRLYVSSGAAGWGAPIRTQGPSAYQIVHLSPAK